MNIDTLVRMANQIARFFESYPEPVAVAGIADHIARFWEPRMRRELAAHVEAGGKDLMPSVIAAMRPTSATSERL